MNYLPLLLLAIPLLSKKENLYKEILSSISLDDLLTILPLLGIKEEQVKAICEILPFLTSDEFDARLLLKKFLPLFLTTINSQQPVKNSTEYDADALKPISSFASEEVSDSLRSYFS